MKTPILSIIIPCYNNGNYLCLMLDSFLKQTVDSWEVIVVDDKSTDKTPIIVKEYTQKEVADSLGISQSYISRLEKRIIKKLKKQIEKSG